MARGEVLSFCRMYLNLYLSLSFVTSIEEVFIFFAKHLFHNDNSLHIELWFSSSPKRAVLIASVTGHWGLKSFKIISGTSCLFARSLLLLSSLSNQAYPFMASSTTRLSSGLSAFSSLTSSDLLRYSFFTSSAHSFSAFSRTSFLS